MVIEATVAVKVLLVCDAAMPTLAGTPTFELLLVSATFTPPDPAEAKSAGLNKSVGIS